MIIPIYLNVAVSIKGSKNLKLNLSNDRNLIYEPRTLEALLLYAYNVDFNIAKVFVRNDSRKAIVVLRNIKFKHVIENDTMYCYIVSTEAYILSTKVLKNNWFRTLLADAIALSTTLALSISTSTVLKILSTILSGLIIKAISV